MRIDAHQHFWRYSPAEYPWISPAMQRLATDYLPPALEAAAAPVGIDGSVAVQARQTVEESRWLLELAAANPFIRGVVGWVDLRAPRVGEQLAVLAADPKESMVEMGIAGVCGKKLVLVTAFDGVSQEAQKYIRDRLLSLSAKSLDMGHISEWPAAVVEALIQ